METRRRPAHRHGGTMLQRGRPAATMWPVSLQPAQYEGPDRRARRGSERCAWGPHQPISRASDPTEECWLALPPVVGGTGAPKLQEQTSPPEVSGGIAGIYFQMPEGWPEQTSWAAQQ